MSSSNMIDLYRFIIKECDAIPQQTTEPLTNLMQRVCEECTHCVKIKTVNFARNYIEKQQYLYTGECHGNYVLLSEHRYQRIWLLDENSIIMTYNTKFGQ